DGKLVAMQKRSSATTTDLWVVDLSRSLASRLTSSASAQGMVWSPDGTRIAYNWNGDGPWDIYQIRANGTGAEPLLRSEVLFKNLTQWSPDGRYILYSQFDDQTGWDVWLLPLEGDRKPIAFLRSRFNEQNGFISPDGHWISYISDDSGRFDVYIDSFP